MVLYPIRQATVAVACLALVACGTPQVDVPSLPPREIEASPGAEVREVTGEVALLEAQVRAEQARDLFLVKKDVRDDMQAAAGTLAFLGLATATGGLLFRADADVARAALLGAGAAYGAGELAIGDDYQAVFMEGAEASACVAESVYIYRMQNGGEGLPAALSNLESSYRNMYASLAAADCLTESTDCEEPLADEARTELRQASALLPALERVRPKVFAAQAVKRVHEIYIGVNALLNERRPDLGSYVNAGRGISGFQALLPVPSETVFKAQPESAPAPTIATELADLHAARIKASAFLEDIGVDEDGRLECPLDMAEGGEIELGTAAIQLRAGEAASVAVPGGGNLSASWDGAVPTGSSLIVGGDTIMIATQATTPAGDYVLHVRNQTHADTRPVKIVAAEPKS